MSRQMSTAGVDTKKTCPPLSLNCNPHPQDPLASKGPEKQALENILHNDLHNERPKINRLSREAEESRNYVEAFHLCHGPGRRGTQEGREDSPLTVCRGWNA